MSDARAKEKLLAQLQMQSENLRSVISELANISEVERRRILRPHAEAGFDWERDDEIIRTRAQLDDALHILNLLEIGYELQVVEESDVAAGLHGIALKLPDLAKLFQSQAMLRYANAYLYFGIRFLAARVARPSWFDITPHPPLTRNSNEQPFPLEAPPSLTLTDRVEAGFRTFLELPATAEISQAQAFLDDFVLSRSEPEELELWLQGLRPALGENTQRHFQVLSDGMAAWALSRADFYGNMDPQPERPAGGWRVADPAAARFALADIYWIARLFRADVSPTGNTTYFRSNWLHLLRFQAELRGDEPRRRELLSAEEVLRSVFDFVCDLIQNSVQITAEKELDAYAPEGIPEPPSTTVRWQAAFEEELAEITRQRNGRRYRNEGLPPASHGSAAGHGGVRGRRAVWRERIRSGRRPENLIGLSLSGGGVRSATFCLGALQGLQELDLLRFVDYLSTVSGGGFIGSWLVGNVGRTSHWLGRLTSWDDSIGHLRRYSSYLAPKTGILSSDTWTMWASWARNAFLIQLTGLAWLLSVLLFALVGEEIFKALGKLPWALWNVPVAGYLAAFMAAIIIWTLLYNLAAERAVTGAGRPYSGKRLRLFAVLPAWIGAFLLASVFFWVDAKVRFNEVDSYAKILKCAWRYWIFAILVIFIALLLLALRTLREKYRWSALWISLLCVFVLYLLFCGIIRVFVAWLGKGYQAEWYAYVLGPPMVLLAHTITVILFIGLCGRYSNESVREWWTRFGTWLSIYGAGYLFFTAAAAFGPMWILALFTAPSTWITWPAVAGWVGSVLSGLLAGNSSKTSGEKSSSPLLQWIAKAGGLIFILGAVLGSATLLYLLLFNIGTNCIYFREYWNVLPEIPSWLPPVALAVALSCGILFSWFFEINIFGLNQFYRNRLVRCYLGATRWAPGLRNPQPFTKFDGRDDMRLSTLSTQAAAGPGTEFRGPFPILNCALNLGGSSDLSVHTRHSASFSLTPLYCGADRARVGYAPTAERGRESFAGGVMLGQAVSISGAAASPNMGFNTSPLVAFLLTMFNVRLGWWFPNPGRSKWSHPGLQFSLVYLVSELFGVADERDKFINISDGGHFENLGIYELVRRGCRVIIAVDGECDEQLTFGSLGNVVRLCETDFGAKIDINVSSIRKSKDDLSLAHSAVGTITYSNGSIGYLIYLKASITGDEDIGVAQYRSAHPSFPHETTADQFFTEDQFESYRRLGQHVVRHSLRGTQPGDHPVSVAERLYDVLTPTGCASEAFLKHSKALNEIWEHFRRTPQLHSFLNELVLNIVSPPDPAGWEVELSIGLELIQLMENVFLDLRLDDFWNHPDNRGWVILFMRFARSPRFRTIWSQTRRTFGIRFERFCAARLGLPRDEPIIRV